MTGLPPLCLVGDRLWCINPKISDCLGLARGARFPRARVPGQRGQAVERRRLVVQSGDETAARDRFRRPHCERLNILRRLALSPMTWGVSHHGVTSASPRTQPSAYRLTLSPSNLRSAVMLRSLDCSAVANSPCRDEKPAWAFPVWHRLREACPLPTAQGPRWETQRGAFGPHPGRETREPRLAAMRSRTLVPQTMACMCEEAVPCSDKRRHRHRHRRRHRHDS